MQPFTVEELRDIDDALRIADVSASDPVMVKVRNLIDALDPPQRSDRDDFAEFLNSLLLEKQS